MKQENAIQLFEEKKVRTLWDARQEKWYFSIVDVISILTDSPNPQVYWRVMKKRLKDEGNELVTNCNRLKILSANAKTLNGRYNCGNKRNGFANKLLCVSVRRILE